MERLVKFDLIGQQFAFYTAAPEEEVAEIIGMVTELVQQNSTPTASGSIPVGKVAVLASLNIASRYVELKRDFETYKKETEKRILKMGEQIGKEIM